MKFTLIKKEFCGPCNRAANILKGYLNDKAEHTYEEIYAKDIAPEVLEELEIRSVPVLIIHGDSEETIRINGMKPKQEDYIAEVEAAISELQR